MSIRIFSELIELTEELREFAKENEREREDRIAGRERERIGGRI